MLAYPEIVIIVLLFLVGGLPCLTSEGNSKPNLHTCILVLARTPSAVPGSEI